MATRDNEQQVRIARKAVIDADRAIVPLPCAVEFVWVLEAVYGFSPVEIAQAVRLLFDMPNLEIDAASVTVGLELLESGGDFADGVIAAAGAAMGGDTFVSFDRKAVSRLQSMGIPAQLASSVA